MSELKGACVIGQSGGPTSVINSSVLGALEAALDNPSITRVFGMAHGIKGLLNDDLYDIDKEDRDELALLRYTPSSALGSCRYKLADPDVDDTDYKRSVKYPPIETSVTSSTTAATTPWIPATRFPSI